ncbi:MAG: flavodoxin family protein [Candidatus Paceibacterota bacterium]
MNNFLLISGSPRKGNTEFILNKIFDSIQGEKELILLREKNIKHCTGCLSCLKLNKCVLMDDMTDIYDKIVKADFIIIGTPNYYDNVTGLLKDFIDRTNPFYEIDKLKNKKIIAIVTGGGSIKNSKEFTGQTLKSFADAHNMKLIASYYFQALKNNEVECNDVALKQIEKIIRKLEN